LAEIVVKVNVEMAIAKSLLRISGILPHLCRRHK
jgi:hypothetical protein